MRKELAAAIAIGAALMFSAGTRAFAASDLDGTTWYATNDDCSVDEVDFDADGSAYIYDYLGDDEDTGRWTLNGQSLHVEYDTWYGGIDGKFIDAGHMEGTDTWREDKTSTVHHNHCEFEMDD